MRVGSLALGLVGVCLLIATASAQPSQQYLDAYNKGVDEYRLGNYAEAVKHLEAAKAIDKSLPGAWRFLGVVAQAEGRWADCVASTREAIRLNPTSSNAPETRKVHDECRAAWGKPAYPELLQPNTGAVSVTTDQVGAAVSIGGIAYGSTPMIKPIAAGTVEIVVTKNGYLPGTQTIEILPEIVNDVDFTLVVDPDVGTDLGLGTDEITHGWVKVVTSVVGVVVEVDGKVVEMDDQGRYIVEAGRHQVTVTADGRERYSKNVRISKGQLLSVKAELRSQDDVTSTRKRGRVLVGAGLGLAVVGAVVGILAIDATDTARDYWTIEVKRPNFSMVPESESAAIAPIHTRAEIADLVDRGKALSIVSTVALGAAAATICVGAYYLVKGRPRGDKAEVRAAVVPLQGGATALAEVRW